jgi:hypothetical protein
MFNRPILSPPAPPLDGRSIGNRTPAIKVSAANEDEAESIATIKSYVLDCALQRPASRTGEQKGDAMINWDQLPEIVGAVAALGAAAFGLVDVTKGLWLNAGNTGFGFIQHALAPFSNAMDAATGTDSNTLVWSHWINGRETAEQKTIAKSLVRMGMDGKTAADIARAVNVDGDALAKVVIKLRAGAELEQTEIALLGRVDSAIDARLDAAFERADRRYRSVARNLAALYSMILSVIAGAAIHTSICAAETTRCVGEGEGIEGFLNSQDLVLSIVVGLVAVPLAPISKDLVTGLKAAVTAFKTAKG